MLDESDVNLGYAELVNETTLAILVKTEAEDEEFWVPKSVISDDSEVYSTKSGEGDLIVHRWWAVKNGHAEKE